MIHAMSARQVQAKSAVKQSTRNGPHSLQAMHGAATDFVTVVEVQEGSRHRSLSHEEFVTVLEVGDGSNKRSLVKTVMEEVSIYRLPGERLGMALKFEGGTCANETITKVFIQNINNDSPASRASGKTLGGLLEGDEILQIEGKPVCGMTRIECVTCLRDAPISISVTVKRDLETPPLTVSDPKPLASSKHGQPFSTFKSTNGTNGSLGSLSPAKKGPPPPVPPRLASTTLTKSQRKLLLEGSNIPAPQTNGVGKSNGHGGHETSGTPDKSPPAPTNGHAAQATGSPGKKKPPPLPPRRPKEPPPAVPSNKGERVSHNSGAEPAKTIKARQQDRQEKKHSVKNGTGLENGKRSEQDISELAPTPEVYVDLFAEREGCHYIESESDDTGSSVSTIIERFSRASTANSSFSDHTSLRQAPTIDLESVLGPFERLERELDHKQALQKFVNETTAALIEHGSFEESVLQNSSLQYDVNLDDYDDIQSVSMNYNVNNVVEVNIEPPNGFETPAQPSSQSSDVPVTAKEPSKAPAITDVKVKSTTKKNAANTERTTVVAATKAKTNGVSPKSNSSPRITEVTVKTNKDTLQTPPTKLKSCLKDSSRSPNSSLPRRQSRSSEKANSLDRVKHKKEVSPVKAPTNGATPTSLIPILESTKSTPPVPPRKCKSTTNLVFGSTTSLDSEPKPSLIPRPILKNGTSSLKKPKVQISTLQQRTRSMECIREENKTVSQEAFAPKPLTAIVRDDPQEDTSNESSPSHSDGQLKVQAVEQKPSALISSALLEELLEEDSSDFRLSPVPTTPIEICEPPTEKDLLESEPSTEANLELQDPEPDVAIPIHESQPADDGEEKARPRDAFNSDGPRLAAQDPATAIQSEAASETKSCGFAAPRSDAHLISQSSVQQSSPLPGNTSPGISAAEVSEAHLETECSSSEVEPASVALPVAAAFSSGEEVEEEVPLRARVEDQDEVGEEDQEGEEAEQVIISEARETRASIGANFIDESPHPNQPPAEQLVPIATKVDGEKREANRDEAEDDMDIRRGRSAYAPSKRFADRVQQELAYIPPTYARQPPDGKEISCSYTDGNALPAGNLPTYGLHKTGFEDSGVFLEADSPSPEFCQRVARRRVSKNGSQGTSSSSDTDAVTSLSSDSMDELDAMPLTTPRTRKCLVARASAPSLPNLEDSAKQVEGDKREASVRERIALFQQKVTSSPSMARREKTPSPDIAKSEIPEQSKTLAADFSKSLLDIYSPREVAAETLAPNPVPLSHHTRSLSLSSSSPSVAVTSDYQQQLFTAAPVSSSASTYSGHLQPSYRRFTSYDPLVNAATTGVGLLTKATTSSSIQLSNLLEARKQTASKLKGLVIPDRPSSSMVNINKTLPTILSSTSSSAALLFSRPEEAASLVRRDSTSSTSSSGSRQWPALAGAPSSLLEPPFATLKNAVPKYSPAFKRRQLELSRSVSGSVSSGSSSVGTPPTPLSPTNFTVANKNDSLFQFSLSHSKPVVPLLPEKPSPATPSSTPTPRHAEITINQVRKLSLDSSGVYPSSSLSVLNTGYRKSDTSHQNTSLVNSNLLAGRSSSLIGSASSKSSASGASARLHTFSSDHSDDESTKTASSSSRAEDSDTDSNGISGDLVRPKELSSQRTVLSDGIELACDASDDTTDSVKQFRALAEKWEQRVSNEQPARSESSALRNGFGVTCGPPPLPPKPKEVSKIPPSLLPKCKALSEAQQDLIVIKTREVNEPASCAKPDQSECSKRVSPTGSSSPVETSSAATLASPANVPSKSKSPTEKTFADDSRQTSKSASQKTPSPEPLDNYSDALANNSHLRMSSMDSTTSDSGTSTPGARDRNALLETGSGSVIGSRASSFSNLRDSQYGSVTSLASSTSLISPQELQQLIEEANLSLEGESQPSIHNIQVVVLYRDYKTSGSVGITLAGGVDYETREITVHKVIAGSIADRDGRIKRGDRILSINGRIIKGATHREALDIMKAPRPEVVLVLSRPGGSSLDLSQTGTSTSHSRTSSTDLTDSSRYKRTSSLSNILDEVSSSAIADSDMNATASKDVSYKIITAELKKDGAGLGFILEGGKDSPLGDRPLAIKKIFKGGLADKEGSLIAGDEILTVNDESVTSMTRTEAWNHLKKLPDAPVLLVVRRKDYGY